jgi:hypothetical protein
MVTAVVFFCALAALGSAATWLSAARRVRRLTALQPSPGAPGERFRISVIVPARNEAESLQPALRTILAQRGVDLEVIVVDDHSSDDTGEIAEALGREDRRLKVLHNPPLRAGWLGKANAMQAGASVATGDLLLFTDADVFHHPDGMASFARVLEAGRLDFISGLPLVELRSLWEHVNVPMHLFGLALASVLLERRLGPGASDAMATGALMLFRRECYETLGGFERVKGQMLDDVGMARVLYHAGRPMGYRLAPECMRVRLFHGNRAAFWGPTKNILVAVEGAEWLAVPVLLLSAAQFLVPPVAAVWGLAAGAPVVALAGLGAYAVQYLSALPLRRIFAFGLVKYAAFPLVVVNSTACMAKALYHRSRGEVFWRGRAIQVRRRRSGT